MGLVAGDVAARMFPPYMGGCSENGLDRRKRSGLQFDLKVVTTEPLERPHLGDGGWPWVKVEAGVIQVHDGILVRSLGDGIH